MVKFFVDRHPNLRCERLCLLKCIKSNYIYKLVKHRKTWLARLTTDQVKPGAGDGDGGDTGKSVTCIEGKTGPRGEKGDRGPAGPPGPSGDKGEPYVPYLMWGEATSCIFNLYSNRSKHVSNMSTKFT